MSDDLTPAETRALAARIMGRPNTPTAIDVIEAAAAQAPDAQPEAPGLPPAGNAEELEELASGAPDTSPPHNPWEPQR